MADSRGRCHLWLGGTFLRWQHRVHRFPKSRACSATLTWAKSLQIPRRGSPLRTNCMPPPPNHSLTSEFVCPMLHSAEWANQQRHRQHRTTAYHSKKLKKSDTLDESKVSVSRSSLKDSDFFDEFLALPRPLRSTSWYELMILDGLNDYFSTKKQLRILRSTILPVTHKPFHLKGCCSGTSTFKESHSFLLLHR